MKKIIGIMCLALMLCGNYTAYAQKKPDNLEYSLHLFYHCCPNVFLQASCN